MKKSLSIKLFLSLFGLTVIILLVSIGLARWSFHYGFNDYLDTLQQETLEDVATELVAYYSAQDGTWDKGINQFLGDIIQNNLLSDNVDQNLQLTAKLRSLPPIDQRSDFPEINNSPRSNTNNDFYSKNEPPQTSLESDSQGMAMGMGRRSEAGLPPPLHNEQHLIILVDANGKRVAGPPSVFSFEDYLSYSIIVDNEIVGELRSSRRRNYQSATEHAFYTQQKITNIAIVMLSLLFAAIASWLLSRMMLTPIVKLKNGIRQLARGDYEHQLEVNRQDELGLLMSDVNKLGLSLNENRSSRKNWLADISHELRTPVTILKGEIEALKDGVRPLNIESVDSLDHEVGRLRHLIDDLFELSLSEIGGLRYSFEPYDVSELLSATINLSKSRILEKGLSLDVKNFQPAYINADIKRLEQLFINIINNSIFYTDAPGVIRVSIELTMNDVNIFIEDSAPSVEDVSLTKMFAPLFREESSRDRRAGGAGLGLAICRNIVHAHDGSVEAVKSELGGVAIKIKFATV